MLPLVLAFTVSACGGDGSGGPSEPSPPPQTTTRIIALSGDLNFGDQTIGQTAERNLRIGNTGNAPLTVTELSGPQGDVFAASWTSGTIAAGGQQDVTLAFSPTDERSYSGTLTVNADQTSGTNTLSITARGVRPPGPRTQFGAGQYIVGTDIAPGRYFSVPQDGCYWERQSGFSGSLDDIIANEFVSFNAAQWIVDILPGDRGFQTDAECRTWFSSQRGGTQATIQPGVWLVGSQIAPGTYRTNAGAGCYWERRRDFQGVFDSIIDNHFQNSAGQAIVTISSSDVGFQTDGDCGTWSPADVIASRRGDADTLAPPETRRTLRGGSAFRTRALGGPRPDHPSRRTSGNAGGQPGTTAPSHISGLAPDRGSP